MHVCLSVCLAQLHHSHVGCKLYFYSYLINESTVSPTVFSTSKTKSQGKSLSWEGVNCRIYFVGPSMLWRTPLCKRFIYHTYAMHYSDASTLVIEAIVNGGLAIICGQAGSGLIYFLSLVSFSRVVPGSQPAVHLASQQRGVGIQDR